MPTGLGSGIERGLAGLAGGLHRKFQSQSEEEARRKAEAALRAFVATGGQMVPSGITGVVDMPAWLRFVQDQNQPSETPQIKTANREDMYWDGTKWVPIDTEYKPKDTTGMTEYQRQRLALERDKLNKPGTPKEDPRLKAIEARKNFLTEQARKVGTEEAEFDYRIFSDPNTELDEFGGIKDQQKRSAYERQKQVYKSRLSPLRSEIMRLDQLLGGEWSKQQMTPPAQATSQDTSGLSNEALDEMIRRLTEELNK